MYPSIVTTMSGQVPSAAVRRFVAWTLRHGRLVWTVAILLAVPAATRTATLYAHLRSDLEELLPRQAPSVLAIDELRSRMPGLQFLGVVVDTGAAENVAAGERLIDDLASRVRTYPPEMVRAVRTGRELERRFLEDNAPLYAGLADLETIRARIRARRDAEVAVATGSALEDARFRRSTSQILEARYTKKLGAPRSAMRSDRFSSAELHTTLLVIEAGRFSTGDAQKELVRRVRDDVAALGGPQRYAPGMRIGFSGSVAISVEEVSALVADLSLSSVLVVVAVMGVIIVYYRWWQSVVVLVVPLLLATVYSFALASLPPFRVTELNSNTAFLGSIIVGNGINFGIILLARYLEERRRGVAVSDALVTSVWSARPGTLSAALAAGASYGALVITEFRGFRQFGIIGGIGMVMSWLVSFVLAPPLLAWLDDSPTTAPREKPEGVVARLAPLVVRFAVPITVAAVVLTAAAAWRVHSFDATQLEYNFARLRRADTWKDGEGYRGRRMDAVLGQYLTPTVLLTDSPGEARASPRRLARGSPTHPSPSSSPLSARPTTSSRRTGPRRSPSCGAIRRDLTPKIAPPCPPRTRDRSTGSSGSETWSRCA